MKLKIKKLNKKAQIPKYQTEGSSGFDLHALEDTRILPGQTKLVSTGLSFEVPFGYELQVRPRSGLSLTTKLRVANSPGTVDADYRGEIKIIMENTGVPTALDSGVAIIKAGDRIAQGVICPIIQCDIEEVVDLSSTERGSSGIGSTGV